MLKIVTWQSSGCIGLLENTGDRSYYKKFNGGHYFMPLFVVLWVDGVKEKQNCRWKKQSLGTN